MYKPNWSFIFAYFCKLSSIFFSNFNYFLAHILWFHRYHTSKFVFYHFHYIHVDQNPRNNLFLYRQGKWREAIISYFYYFCIFLVIFRNFLSSNLAISWIFLRVSIEFSRLFHLIRIFSTYLEKFYHLIKRFLFFRPIRFVFFKYFCLFLEFFVCIP